MKVSKVSNKILLSLLAIGLVVSTNSYSMKRSADDSRQEDRTCLICQEEIGDSEDYAKSLNCTCRNIFHPECLANWFGDELVYEEEAIVDGEAVRIATRAEEKDAYFQKGCPVCKVPGSLAGIQIFKATKRSRHDEVPVAAVAAAGAPEDYEFEMALRLSVEQQRLDEEQRRERDEEELFQAIAMSLEGGRVEVVPALAAAAAAAEEPAPQPSWFSRFWPFRR